jgi:hypothetical protein
MQMLRIYSKGFCRSLDALGIRGGERYTLTHPHACGEGSSHKAMRTDNKHSEYPDRYIAVVRHALLRRQCITAVRAIHDPRSQTVASKGRWRGGPAMPRQA